MKFTIMNSKQYCLLIYVIASQLIKPGPFTSSWDGPVSVDLFYDNSMDHWKFVNIPFASKNHFIPTLMTTKLQLQNHFSILCWNF
jgi:hypothetical protein